MSKNSNAKKDKLTEAWAALLDTLEAQLQHGHLKNVPGATLAQDHIDTLKNHFGVTEPGEPEEN